jgi:hypothetical protein
VRRARYSFPSFGIAMHIASSARSRRSREVSSAWRRGWVGLEPGAASCGGGVRSLPPPLAGVAATTLPITIAGSRSSRSATRRTRSSRPAVSPIPASTGATSASAWSRATGDPVSVRPRTRPTWKAVSSSAFSSRPRNRSGPSSAAIISAGSSPAGIAATRRRIRRPAATVWARSIASCPAESASSASTTSSTIPESAATCSPVIAVPITPTASSTPAWCRARTSV